MPPGQKPLGALTDEAEARALLRDAAKPALEQRKRRAQALERRVAVLERVADDERAEARQKDALHQNVCMFAGGALVLAKPLLMGAQALLLQRAPTDGARCGGGDEKTGSP